MTDHKTNAIHEPRTQEEPVKGSSDRSFGIVFTVVFAVIGLWPLIRNDGVRLWPLTAAGVLLALSLIRPLVLAPLNRLWTKFGLLLQKLTNPIIMALVFYVAVTPTAFIMRVLGKDPLHKKFDPAAKSYWIERAPPGPAPETMKNQF